MMPPYKSKTGGYYTLALFHEPWQSQPESERPIPAVFSFNAREGLIDARKSFIELRDPTGYLWSQKYLKSWDHFTVLLKAKWFEPEYTSWVEELKIILKQEALKKIADIASSESPQALPAAKYLAAAEWEKPAHGRGRPSKEVLRGELAKAVKALTIEEEDAQRIGFTVIQGGKS